MVTAHVSFSFMSENGRLEPGHNYTNRIFACSFWQATCNRGARY